MLKEKILLKTLPSKMKCYIIPKKDYVEKQASLSVNYGSVDNAFIIDGVKKEMPDGIAHFLEHKLFEDRKKNVFDEFTKLGGSVNAYTNYTNTAYYFNCVDNFDDNLKLLLKFTSSPYFTDKNVEKEKGIIIQEIEMYNDNPFWNVYLNLLKAMYKNCPINKNIAGSSESVSSINKDLLYECYNTFYKPENMILVCVGDLEPEDIFDKVSKWSEASEMSGIERIYGDEPYEVSQNFVEHTMALSRPMFDLGFKDSDFESTISEKMVGTKILMDVIAGESSTFFEDLYSKGLIDGPFALDYSSGHFYGTAVFSNSGSEPKEICERIIQELEKIKNSGIDKQRFEQIRRKHIGYFLKNFNYINSISTSQTDFHFKGTSFADIMNIYENIDIASAQSRLKHLFRKDNYVISIINPV